MGFSSKQSYTDAKKNLGVKVSTWRANDRLLENTDIKGVNKGCGDFEECSGKGLGLKGGEVEENVKKEDLRNFMKVKQKESTNMVGETGIDRMVGTEDGLWQVRN